MGSKYWLRVCWYIALGLAAIAVVWIRTPILGAAFLSAVACYIPASLLWMLLGSLLQRAIPRSKKLFGIGERTLQISIIFGGFCTSALFLSLGQATVASFGVVAMLAGIDDVILSSEVRTAIAI
jgi:hypothetical protein